MKILIITRSYPYEDTHEKSFIKSELEAFLQNNLDVILMPFGKSKAMDRDLLNNLELLPNFQKQKSLLHILKVLLFLAANKYFYREIKKEFKLIFSSLMRFKNFFKYSIKAQMAYLALKEIQYNGLIYTYWCTGETVGALWYASESSDRQVITRMHGYDIYEERDDNKNYIPYREYVCKNLDEAILLSNQAKNYIREKYPLEESAVIVSPLGVASQDYIKNYDNSKGDLYFYSCSYYHPVKRVELIYDVLLNLSQNNKDKTIHWTHLGIQPDEINLNQAEKSENFFYALEGWRSKEEIFSTYLKDRKAYFINLSSSEGQPVSVMEAMSYGLPVIATDVGGVKELLGETGLLVSSTDTLNDIVENIEEYLVKDYEDESVKSSKQQAMHYDQKVNHQRLCKVLKERFS